MTRWGTRWTAWLALPMLLAMSSGAFAADFDGSQLSAIGVCLLQAFCCRLP